MSQKRSDYATIQAAGSAVGLGRICTGGESRKILRGFLRVNGVNRKLKTVYIGMNGAARKIVG